MLKFTRKLFLGQSSNSGVLKRFRCSISSYDVIIAAASRIQGVTPSTVVRLLKFIKSDKIDNTPHSYRED
uniref:Uncharacterized protein n=1 Tax=Megaselia scalaris TaxID=36166 RepID=T1H261_MEGSC